MVEGVRLKEDRFQHALPGCDLLWLRNRWLRSKTRLRTGYFPDTPPGVGTSSANKSSGFKGELTDDWSGFQS